MKKKLLSILLASAMAAAMLAGCGSTSSAPTKPDAAEQSTEAAASAVASSESSVAKSKIGVLTVLNISEEEYEGMMQAYRKVRRIMTDDDRNLPVDEWIFYDNLDAMQMALESGEIDRMEIPKSTADYLIANNDKMQICSGPGKYDQPNEERTDGYAGRDHGNRSLLFRQVCPGRIKKIKTDESVF